MGMAVNITEATVEVLETFTEATTSTLDVVTKVGIAGVTKEVLEAVSEANIVHVITTEVSDISSTVAESMAETAAALMESVTSALIENITEKSVIVNALTAAIDGHAHAHGVTEGITAFNVTMMDTMDNETTTEHVLNVEDLKNSMDAFFLIINSFIIFFLQGGFAFLEAGSVRSKNTTNILIKNLLDILMACLAFWVFGYMFFYGKGNAFIGTEVSLMCSVDMDISLYAHWFWSFVFCATAATIVSGAMAERCELTAYFAYSIVISGLLYPVVAHWAWTEEGWLNVNGYVDFAGSGVVHHLGGVCGFVGAVFLGPRIGRFDARGKPQDIQGHSVPLAALGAFILLFGFFAFNGSTQGAVARPEDMEVVVRAVMNTMIGGAASGITTLVFFRFSLFRSSTEKIGKWSLLSTINGTLTGMITTCAFCNLAEPHVTFFVGIVAGFVFILIHYGMIWLKIDDPLDAVAVHSGGGILGVLVTPLVISEGGVFNAENEVTAMHQMWSQLVGILVITAWSGTLSALIFYVLKLNNLLRVPRETELAGLDILKHGEAAYPAEAWREIQYGDGAVAGARGEKEVAHSLPPNMGQKSAGEPFGNDLEMKVAENKPPVTQNKMIGSWRKVNMELKKQMVNLEDYKDSEVVLTVKPVGFRKLLPSESDTDSTASCSGNKIDYGGFTNDGFENEDTVDYRNHSQDENSQQFKETHFGTEDEQVDGTDDDQEKKKGVVNPEAEFHSSTLRVDVPSESCSGKMDFENESKDDGIYEQLTDDIAAVEVGYKHPLAGPMQKILDEEKATNTTLEFNNSKESSII